MLVDLAAVWTAVACFYQDVGATPIAGCSKGPPHTVEGLQGLWELVSLQLTMPFCISQLQPALLAAEMLNGCH